MRPRSCRLTWLAIAVAWVAVFGCSRQELHPTVDVVLELVDRSGEVPHSMIETLAMPRPDRVCIFDSYEVQIVCGDRGWTDPIRIGRPGQGPEELGRHGSLVAGPEGGLVFIDLGNRRLVRYTDGLRFAGSVPLEGSLMPLAPITTDGVLAAAVGSAPGSARSSGSVRWIDVRTGAVRRSIEITSVGETPTSAPSVMIVALQIGDGMLVTRPERGRLALYDIDSGSSLVVETPAVNTRPIYPSEYDVERYTEGWRWITRGRDASPEQVREFRSTPLSPYLRGGADQAMQVDGRGRLWVGTNRLGSRGSYIDIFDLAGAYQGSVEIDDRLIAFQIRDETLVALVASRAPDALGMHPRRFDWYRIRQAE
jgi:hypothetical protein